MAKRSLSLRAKLILASTLLLIAVIGIFGTINVMQSRRIINDFQDQLQERIKESLSQAGTAQLRLLSEAVRIALVQNDYSTLQAMVQQIGDSDNRVTTAAVVDTSGIQLAHNDRKKIGSRGTGWLEAKKAGDGIVVTPDIQIGGEQSIAFAMPIVHEGERLGLAALAYSLRPLANELARAEAIKKEELQNTLRNSLLVAVFSVLVGIMLTVLQGVRITRPLQALALQADQIAGGDLQARVEVRTRDEIGVLGDRFNYMADQVLALMRETMHKATMEKELEVASAVQATLVPNAATAELPGLTLAGYYKSATQCGGDWWSHYELAGGRLMVIIGDVTGHGVAAAMITAVAKGAATSMIASTHGQTGLQATLEAMNAAIHDAAKGRFVMTCFASIYDPATGTLEFANAGHNFPYLLSKATGKISALVLRGNRLGDVLDSSYETRSIQVHPADMLVWYTDGIIECEDARGEEYGERRFRNVLRNGAALSPPEMRDTLVARAFQHFGDVPQKDDITLIVGRFGEIQAGAI